MINIRNWEQHFEKHENGRVRNMRWVPVPVAHDGKGFRRIMAAQNGATVYGCWVLLLQVAAKCAIRGTLADEDGPLSVEDIAFKTGARVEDFKAAIPVLLQVGWLEEIEESAQKRAEVRKNTRVQDKTRHYITKQKNTVALRAPDLPETLATDTFRAAWGDWCTYRSQIKKKLSATTAAAQLAKLAAWGEPAAVAAIRESIAQGWTGLFEPKGERAAPKEETFDEAADRIAAELRRKAVNS